jgi:hypothetical protein
LYGLAAGRGTLGPTDWHHTAALTAIRPLITL